VQQSSTVRSERLRSRQGSAECATDDLDGDELRRDRQFEPPQVDPKGEAHDGPSKTVWHPEKNRQAPSPVVPD